MTSVSHQVRNFTRGALWMCVQNRIWSNTRESVRESVAPIGYIVETGVADLLHQQITSTTEEKLKEYEFD